MGGLLGGVVAVEGVKRWLGVTTRTGDLFAVPLTLGIAIGRVGCFLAGLPDGTSGNPTAVWAGVNFGDGVPRHPTQLYEIGFLLALGWVLLRVARGAPQAGDVFRVFMIGYLGFRLVVDAIKPAPVEGFGLSAIQWASLAGLLCYLPDMRRWGWSLRTIDRSGGPHA